MSAATRARAPSGVTWDGINRANVQRQVSRRRDQHLPRTDSRPSMEWRSAIHSRRGRQPSVALYRSATCRASDGTRFDASRIRPDERWVLRLATLPDAWKCCQPGDCCRSVAIANPAFAKARRQQKYPAMTLPSTLALTVLPCELLQCVSPCFDREVYVFLGMSHPDVILTI